MPKTVMLSDEAYKALDRLKKGKESFSKVIMRITKTEKKGARS